MRGGGLVHRAKIRRGGGFPTMTPAQCAGDDGSDPKPVETGGTRVAWEGRENRQRGRD
jgi:hypothetical protein